MAKNLIPQIAKMLGVGIDDVFTLRYFGRNMIPGEFMLTKHGLFYRANKDFEWEQDRANFVGILNGNLTIEKLPYKPKYGEAYCTYATDDDKWVVNCKIWTDWVEEFTALKCGIVFRTREEAEAALPAKYEELTGRKFSGNDEE